MNKPFFMCIVALWIAGLQTAGAQQNAAQIERLLARAHHKATVDGDLPGAIEEYKRIVATPGVSRTVAVHALLRMAESYQRLGDTQATQIYQRVLREFTDQKEAAAVARAHLGAERTGQQTGMVLRRVWDGKGAAQASAAILTTVSQDGRRLSYLPFAAGGLHVRDLMAASDRAVTAGDGYEGPSAISRDGTHVAYESYGGRYGSELRVVSVQDSGVPPSRQLYENADVAQITPMDFSPDGGSVAVTLVRKDRTKQIALVDARTGSLTVLKSVDWRGPTRMFFSPDGHDLAFDLPASDSSFQRDVFVLAINGSREVAAVVHPSNDIVMGWSPDGKRLLFASDRRGGAMGLWGLAFAERKPRGMPELVKESLGSAWSLGVTRSGTLYMGTAAGDRDIGVVSIDLTTGEQSGAASRPISSFIGTNLQPAWSRDGRSLAYVSLRSYNPVFNITRILAIRSVETGEVRDLRPDLVYFNQMSWAPDGSALAAGGTDLKGRDGIFRIDAQTGNVQPIVLLESGSNAYPQWSPDGHRIYYRRPAADNESAFIERDLNTGSEREIVRGLLGSINLSPDGRSIVAQRTDPSTKSDAVVLIPVEGGEPKELLRFGRQQRVARFAGIPWTPNGREVIVRTIGDAGELWLVPISGEPPRRLNIDVTSWATGNFGVISLHPDGRRIAFLSGQQRAEVWALENFLPR